MTAPDIVFMDVESSGLHEGSYPIEFGWARPDVDFSSGSFLVRPADEWSEDLWSLEGEIVHGIRRDLCLEVGFPVLQAAHRLNRTFGGKRVYSDNAEFDRYWTARLFEAAREPCRFGIDDAQGVFFEAAMGVAKGAVRVALALCGEAVSKTREFYPHTHRAAPDAVGLAAAYRFIGDDAFRSEVRRRSADKSAAALIAFEG